MRTIKRYANRKLYDTAEKRYLTLAHLGELVGDGERIRVVDNDSGEDITNVILSKALSGKEKESGGFLTTELLSNLLQGGPNQLLDYLKQSWQTGGEYLNDVEAELDARLKTFIDRGKLSTREALKFRDSLVDGLRGRWQTLEKSVGKGLTSAMDAIPIASRRDVERLEKRLEELAARLGELDADEVQALAARPARTRKPAAKKKAPARKKAVARKKASAKKAAAKKTARKRPAKKKAAARKPAAKKAAASGKKKAPAKKRVTRSKGTSKTRR